MKNFFFYILIFFSLTSNAQPTEPIKLGSQPACLSQLSADTIPPYVEQTIVVNSHQIDIYFNEPLDFLSAQAAVNFYLTVLGNPSTVSLDAINKRLIHLYFAYSLASNTSYTLATNNVKDTSENIMLPHIDIINTPYFAVPGDIIVNEIMVKPPAVGLPAKQYVELINTTSNYINIKDWTINYRVLDEGIVAPFGYIILCSEQDTSAFKTLGNTAGVRNWPYLTYNGAVTIRTDENEEMDFLPYTEDTYQDAVKKLGGWSMELDSQRYSGNCPKDLFWSASNNLLGGTPGTANSKGYSIRYINATDTLVNNTTLEIDFHRPMNKDEIENTANYIFDNGIVVQFAESLDAYTTKAKVTLATPLQPNIVYTFIIKQFAGCIGNIHAPDTFEIAITEIPKAGELIINEILFHPNADGEQFVELYNNTNKLFKIKDLIIAQADAISGIENQLLNLAGNRGYIFPNDYVVFSRNKNTIKSQYNKTVISKCVNAALPAFDTKEDIVILKNAENAEIDKLHYNENWHSPLLATKQGISLERTGFATYTQNKRNWHSAAQSVFATPGYLNSEDTYEFQNAVHIVPEVFSPDGDGVDDEAIITYAFEEAGSVVNVYIYNADGRLANHLVNDIAVSKEGFFTWNGDDENGNKKDVGIYFLVFERKKPDGTKIIYKHKCVLAAKLN